MYHCLISECIQHHLWSRNFQIINNSLIWNVGSYIYCRMRSNTRRCYSRLIMDLIPLNTRCTLQKNNNNKSNWDSSKQTFGIFLDLKVDGISSSCGFSQSVFVTCKIIEYINPDIMQLIGHVNFNFHIHH